MAIVKTGERLVKKTFFAEKEEWERLIALSKATDKSVGLWLRETISKQLKFDELKAVREAEKRAALKTD
jgi:predicted DNA-binding protein